MQLAVHRPAFAATPVLARSVFRMSSSFPAATSRGSTSPNASVAPHRTALITGASGGIGAETAEGLLRNLPTLERLFLCARDISKTERVANLLRNVSPNVEISVHSLELSSLQSARICARQVHTALNGRRLDLAVLNAGVMACPRAFSKENIEYQYAVNHLAHAAFFLSLREILGRVVLVSSLAAAISRTRETAPVIEELKRENLPEDKYSAWKMYGDSKLAMALYARGRAALGDQIVALHPGVVATELQRHVLPNWLHEWSVRDAPVQNLLKYLISWFGIKTPKQGAELSIHLATVQEGGFRNGGFYIAKDREFPMRMVPLLEKNEQVERLVKDTDEFVELFVKENENGAPVQLGDLPVTSSARE